ncbi:MAG: ABC transporter ATP-binding protein [Candidatus Sericytochromatia bacterium]|nr:ABC transporter ATP-binding protein [Candidatus Tanganyikabacteria bacterium]
MPPRSADPGLASDPLLEARGVRKVFQRDGEQLEILAGIDLQVRAGEFVAITGPSGSGKSTLLYLLGALDRPTSGEIRLLGRATNELEDAALASIRNTLVGFVFQFHFLLMDLTALENVMVPAMVGGASPQQCEAKARALLDRVGLSHRLTHRPAQLSGGEQQRVAVARALMNGPALLLGDELTGNLDTAASESIYQLLREHNRAEGQTIVVVTHNPALAAHADRVLEMVDGKILGISVTGQTL